MPRYDNLLLEQRETIRKFIEESDTINAANPAELARWLRTRMSALRHKKTSG